MLGFLRLSAVVGAVLLGAGCAAGPSNAYRSPNDGAVESGEVAFAAEPIAQAETTNHTHSAADELPQEPDIYSGTGRFVNLDALASDATTRAPSDPVTLNFGEADIRDVIRSVLGETLGLTYVIADGVEGQITFRSASPIDRPDVFSAFESVLQLHGTALIATDGIIQVIPASRARGRAQIFGEGHAAGYGVEIVPLRYISVDEARRVLLPFAPSGAVLEADRSRNILLLAGTRSEIDTLVETLAIFDVDWLSEMSFAMFYPEQVDVRTLASELEGIFNRTESPIAGVVELVPIERINALLVISPRSSYFDEVRRWIDRLDRRANTPGPRIYYYRAQNLRADDLASSLSTLLEIDVGGIADEGSETGGTPGDGTRIVSDDENNALMIYATPEQFALIEDALAQIDVAPAQVLIEAVIAEVTLTDELDYGVQWFLDSDESQFTLSGVSSGAVTSAFPGFSYVFRNSNLDVALNALSSVTDVNVLSAPTLMVLNNRTATLQVGDQVPVATQSAVSVSNPDAPIVNSVQFRDTGVILQVTPRINNSGLVILEISQEVSDVIETTSSGIDSPTIRQRKIDSIVAVQDGETIVLGGLIRESDNQTRSGLPLLMRIPLFGRAFRSDSVTTRRTELLIFITPRIARDASSARDATDYMRDRLRSVSERLEEIGR